MAFDQGPYLQTAVFCEKVLTEQDGVLSLIRIVDRVTHTRTDPGAPDTLPPFDYQLTLVVTLKSGKATGRHTLKIERQLPSGELQHDQSAQVPVFLEGENRGANIVIEVGARFEMEGVYWYNLSVDDELLTRMPIEIRYARLAVGA